MVAQFYELLGVSDVEQINRTTPREFEYLIKGAELRQVKELDYIHKQAWANNLVRATKNKGKDPYYKEYKDFFDYRKARDEALYSEVEEDQKRIESRNLKLIAQRVKELG